MTKITIATKLANLTRELRDTKYKWFAVELKCDKLINIDPHSDECVAACKLFHELRIKVAQIEHELSSLRVLL